MGRGQIKITRDGERWKLDASALSSPTGKRQRAWFRTKGEAQAEKDRLETLKHNFGVAGGSLRVADIEDALAALALLRPLGMTLLAAAQEAAALRARESVTLEELYERFLASPSKRGTERRAETLRSYREAWGMAKSLAARPVADIGPEEIEALMPKTQARAAFFYRHAAAWFNYGVRKGLLDVSPMARVDRWRAPKRKIEILTVDQCRALLEAARDKVGGALLPYVALGLFAGVRPRELRRMDWRDIDRERGAVRVVAEASKVDRARSVPIREALASWLPAGGEGPVVPAPKFRENWREVRDASGIVPWPQDGMRHSFATYHFAAFGDIDRLLGEMGHRSLDTTRDHYLDGVTQAEGKAFWALRA